MSGPPETGPPGGPRPEGSPAPVLSLDRLSLSFGGLRALSELDLGVGEREIVSLIGPNGAGKTTVFNVITGVYEPNSGDVRFAGRSFARQALRSSVLGWDSRCARFAEVAL